jgi:hypothetical protein
MHRFILRIRVDGKIWRYDDVANQWRVIRECLTGAFDAGISGECWRGLPAPALTNKRARFYFTERGWHEVGQHVYAEAKRRGHVVSVLRRREPLDSQVVYRDEWQVAILPDKRRRSDAGGQPS